MFHLVVCAFIFELFPNTRHSSQLREVIIESIANTLVVFTLIVAENDNLWKTQCESRLILLKYNAACLSVQLVARFHSIFK